MCKVHHFLLLYYDLLRSYCTVISVLEVIYIHVVSMEETLTISEMLLSLPNSAPGGTTLVADSGLGGRTHSTETGQDHKSGLNLLFC